MLRKKLTHFIIKKKKKSTEFLTAPSTELMFSLANCMTSVTYRNLDLTVNAL